MYEGYEASARPLLFSLQATNKAVARLHTGQTRAALLERLLGDVGPVVSARRVRTGPRGPLRSLSPDVLNNNRSMWRTNYLSK